MGNREMRYYTTATSKDPDARQVEKQRGESSRRKRKEKKAEGREAQDERTHHCVPQGMDLDPIPQGKSLLYDRREQRNLCSPACCIVLLES